VLNWAARYFPMLRVLKQHGFLKNGSLLEIGSGHFGIGAYRKVPFTGCDIDFPVKPRQPMTPIIASAANLPLADKSFDVVIASDVLEHVPPVMREKVIQEALRVARSLVIFGFPCGVAAHDSDRELKQFYLTHNIPVPGWLEEHMLAPFPDSSLVQNIRGWDVVQFGNENLKFHEWLVRREVNRWFVHFTGRLARHLPWLVDPILRRADHEPSYRQIFVLTPDSQTK
jgi:ubiquinone/menaquinone biosynthesis C-methylase UbiE